MSVPFFFHFYSSFFLTNSKDRTHKTIVGFRVPEVTSASIKGLQGLKFVDKTVEGTPTLDEAREEVF